MSSPAVTTMASRRGLWRWFVALVATVLLVVSGSGLVAFAQSGAGESKGPQFVPADAPIYIEARLDMPDGQAEALADFMTAFPGFADAGSFGMKTDEIVDGLVEQVTDGALTFSGEMESFLTGEMGLAMTDLESAAMTSEDPLLLVGIAVSDRAGAESFMELLTAGAAADGELSEEMYGNTAIVSNASSAIAVHDEWILASQDAEQVKAGIDALEGTVPSLADDADFTAAFARLPAARLGAAYMNLQSFGSFIDLAGMVASGQTGVDVPTADLAALLPNNMVAYLAAEADRMTLEAFITPSDGTPAVAVGESALAELFPADTQLYIETRELGTILESALTGALEMMEEGAAQQIAPIESMLGEPLPSFLDFVADAGVGAGLSSDGLWLGIAAEVNDEATADARMERIMSVVRLLGVGADTGMSIESVSIDDHTVSVITVPLDDALSGSGLPIGVGDTISVAVANGSLLIGTGDFVENALTMPAVDSLGSSAGYTDALAGDTVNTGVLYANISALLTAVDPIISMMVPEWADIQPYATGLDRMIAVGTADDEVLGVRMTVIANQ
jgi:hypothetical protein